MTMSISIELFDSDAQWIAKHLYVLRTEWMLELRRRRLDAAPDATLTSGLTADSDTAKRILDRIERALITPVITRRAPEYGDMTLAQLLTDSGYTPAEVITWSPSDQGEAMREGWLIAEHNDAGTPYVCIERADEQLGSGIPNDDASRAWVDACAAAGFRLHRRARAYIEQFNAKVKP
ncbi:MAG: hypothetical protein HC794_01175 [Nitrospiraceae bacterium]|nr:hypothetical protein [Nitrospiraceae bacterium]